MSNGALLQVADAHIAYGKVEAVRGVTLDVAGNEIVTIIGANGAGKTTLLNAIMGTSRASTHSGSPRQNRNKDWSLSGQNKL